GSALHVVAVDAFVFGDPAHLVDSVDHGPAHSNRRVAPVTALEGGSGCREQGRAPAAVTPGRAETRNVLLDHRDADSRVAPGQVIRSPEAGQAPARDRDVNVEISGQGGAGGQASWHG